MDNSSISLAELESWKSTECFQRFLESQKELVHSQIDQLQNIVVTQCKLTGANPLSQEMAAGALSINIGKRPRDLLNPKAIKYMQSVFSIKDAVSKKESREISALCGVTVTQVREFFAGQRARVRKLARLSREKAVKSDACKISQDGSFPSSDTSFPVINPAPLNSVDPKATEEAPSCSSQGETIPGIDEADKTFVENIFNMMRREVTFSGQVKLMDWILQTQNSSVLNWFLNKGGLMILTAWLSDASLEEQTTVLLVIFKVLCHLPLHKALPMQMSAILQTVNRLRFYRTSDISNRAKVLLSRWSKMFVRNQALKKPSITNSSITAQIEKNLKQSSSGMLGNEWQSNVDLPEEILHLAFKSSEDIRNSESSPATKLLTSSTDDSNKKQNRGVSSVQTRERRKVMPMEQPGRNNNSRNVQVARAIPSNQARPMSTDDIQKAKMRAIYMQDKYGKNGSSSSNENQQQKIGNLDKSSTSQTRHLLSAPKLPLRQKIEEGNSPKLLSSEPPSTLAEEEAPKVLASETSALSETPLGSKPSFAPPEPSWEKLKISQIPWHMPPEVRISSLWRVGVGEKSKEVEIQVGRIKREKETMYQRFQDAPPNPKEPWDLEIDHDDTLTPEIPTEQPPDPDAPEPQPEPSTTSYNVQNNTSQTHASATVIAASQPLPITTTSTTETAAEPDLELLAVLLKNPQLVFALTSGQGSNNLTSAETVKLLDLIKNSQVDLTGVLNGLEGDAQKVEEPVSLPSPTPPSERMNEWRPEVVKNSFSLPVPMGNSVNGFLQTSLQPILPPQEQQLLATAPGLQPQPQITNFSHPQLKTTVTVTPPTQHLPPVLNTGNFASRSNAHPFSDHLGRSQLHEAQQPRAMNSTSNQLLNQAQQGIMVHTGVPSLHHSEPLTYGQIQNLRPALIVQNPPKDRLPNTAPPHLQTLPPRRGMPQQHLPHEPQLQHLQSTLQWNALNSNSSSSSRQTHLPELIINRQKAFESSGSGSNPWSHSNQNNYNVFPDDAGRLSQPSWERDECLDEPEFEMWSPERSPERSRSRSLEYRSGQSYSDSRRESSRSSRTDWSRRRDSGRRDHRHGSSRRWRDNRRH